MIDHGGLRQMGVTSFGGIVECLVRLLEFPVDGRIGVAGVRHTSGPA